MEHYIDKKIERRSPSFLYMYRYFDNPTLYWQKIWETVPSFLNNNQVQNQLLLQVHTKIKSSKSWKKSHEF